MNRQIMEMLNASEGRYLTAVEQRALREYAQGLDARLEAMTEIGNKEAATIDHTLKELFSAYSDIDKKYKNAMQSCTRDVSMVLRYATQAMVRNDLQYLDDSLLTWMATMLKGVGLAPQFIEDTYKALALTANKEFSPATAKLIGPFILHCATVLSGRSDATTSAVAMGLPKEAK